MFSLEIGCHATTHRALFNTKEEAQAQLDLLQPKIGQRFFGKNGDLECSHTIKTPTGDMIVSMEKVEVARIIDLDVWNEMAAAEDLKSTDRATELEIRRRTALARAGADLISGKAA